MANEPPLLHPQMSDVSRERVSALCQALEQENGRSEATEGIRQLVETIILEPEPEANTLAIRLKGDLAAMLAAKSTKRPPDTGDLLVSIQLIAGACNQLDWQEWLSARDSIDDTTLPTTSHLSTRAARLRRSAQWLDFSRSLISVETLICAGFWIALHPGEASRVWPLAAAIACGGFLLVGGLSWLLSRTRREMTGVESIASAMQSGE